MRSVSMVHRLISGGGGTHTIVMAHQPTVLIGPGRMRGFLISLFKRFVFYFFGEMVMSVIYNGSGDESDATLIFLGVK